MPAIRARALYGEDDPTGFRNDLEAHLLGGVVISTPEVFLMGRPVCSTAPIPEISDPWQAFPGPHCDAWFVWCGAGTVGAMLEAMPYPLPRIGWGRGGAVRFYELSRLAKRFESAQIAQ